MVLGWNRISTFNWFQLKIYIYIVLRVKKKLTETIFDFYVNFFAFLTYEATRSCKI